MVRIELVNAAMIITKPTVMPAWTAGIQNTGTWKKPGISYPRVAFSC